MPITPTAPGRTPTRPAERSASPTVVVANADPAGEIALGIDVPDGDDAHFETRPPYEGSVVVGRGRNPSSSPSIPPG